MRDKDLLLQYFAGIAFTTALCTLLEIYVSASFFILNAALLAGNFIAFIIRMRIRDRSDSEPVQP